MCLDRSEYHWSEILKCLFFIEPQEELVITTEKAIEENSFLLQVTNDNQTKCHYWLECARLYKIQSVMIICNNFHTAIKLLLCP